MPKASTPVISIAIPTYNREEVLINTINDVLSQSFKQFELLVIDQSSSHEKATSLALKNIRDPRFRYFRTTPASVTAARNFAMSKAESPYIIFLDDDVKLRKDLVKVYINTFKEKPDISAIAGRVMQEGFPIGDRVLRFDRWAMTNGTYTALSPDYTNAFPGGNCALKIEDALAAGGFDTRYRGNAFREENDMSMRMYLLGQKIYYEPKAELFHLAAPYGGNRVYTEIYDNPGFYINELFFTLRFVTLSNLPTALKVKYKAYCLSVRHFPAYRRRCLFIIGLIRAAWRIVFGKRVIAMEVKK